MFCAHVAGQNETLALHQVERVARMICVGLSDIHTLRVRFIFPKCNVKYVVSVTCSHSKNVFFFLHLCHPASQTKSSTSVQMDSVTALGFMWFSWWWWNCTNCGKFYNCHFYYAIFVNESVPWFGFLRTVVSCVLCFLQDHLHVWKDTTNWSPHDLFMNKRWFHLFSVVFTITYNITSPEAFYMLHVMLQLKGNAEKENRRTATNTHEQTCVALKM